MKSLLDLVVAVLENAGLLCGIDVRRDINVVTRRSKNEGEEFLTVTLAGFCDAFERSLETGGCASVPFPNFRKRGGYPLFLGGMLTHIFCDKGRTVRPDASVQCIQAVRQVCRCVSKLFEVCDQRYIDRSVEQFRTCEQELEEQWLDPRLLRELESSAAVFFGDELSALDEACFCLALEPKHGPGATADGLVGNDKFSNRIWSRRLEDVAPATEMLLPSYRREHAEALEILEPEDEPPVKVTAVPKTARKARIIAIEPTYRQWAQQGVLSVFRRVLNGLTVDLSSQEHNRSLAREGSISGLWATLDLSEASDRVHLDVVKAVFRRYPHLLAYLLASRGTTARLPSGEILHLRKFASMGSATCFPVESLVFAIIALNAVKKAVDSSSRERCPQGGYRGTVRVFGDDIIVPTRFVHHVVRDLVALGNKPNPSKSFWNGKFRESCGGEFYNGEDVTFSKLRKRLPRSHHDAAEILSLVAFRNHCYDRGYWSVASKIDERFSSLGVPMPIVEASSAIAGRRSVFHWRPQRHSADYQAPLVRGVMVEARPPRSIAEEYACLVKCLVPERREPYADPSHLQRNGRPHRVRTKVGWGTPF